jgi:hypothetical protein
MSLTFLQLVNQLQFNPDIPLPIASSSSSSIRPPHRLFYPPPPIEAPSRLINGQVDIEGSNLNKITAAAAGETNPINKVPATTTTADPSSSSTTTTQPTTINSKDMATTKLDNRKNNRGRPTSIKLIIRKPDASSSRTTEQNHNDSVQSNKNISSSKRVKIAEPTTTSSNKKAPTDPALQSARSRKYKIDTRYDDSFFAPIATDKSATISRPTTTRFGRTTKPTTIQVPELTYHDHDLPEDTTTSVKRIRSSSQNSPKPTNSSKPTNTNNNLDLQDLQSISLNLINPPPPPPPLDGR